MEDWQKKFYANRMNGGSVIPASEPYSPRVNAPLSPTKNGEIDIGNELMNRMMSKMQGSNVNMNGFAPPGFVPGQQPSGPKQVQLKVGHPFYREMQTGGFGNGGAPLVKESGTIVENISKNVF